MPISAISAAGRSAGAWLGFVFPALVSTISARAPSSSPTRRRSSTPLYRLVPEWALLPMIGLATLADHHREPGRDHRAPSR